MLYWPGLRPKQIVQALGLRRDRPERADKAPRNGTTGTPPPKPGREPAKGR